LLEGILTVGICIAAAVGFWAYFVALRDSLRGRTDVDKSYKRAVRVHEGATRKGAWKKVANKEAHPRLRKAA